MDLYEGIITRRSVRRWLDKPVENDVLKDVVRAGMYAPSSHNVKNWEFVIVTDANKKMLLSQVQPYVKIIANAPVIAVVCGDISISREAEAFWVQNCSAAMQNMLLAIHGKGMGAVWCAIHPMPEAETSVREILNLPPHIQPLGFCAFGYPERETKRHPERFDESKLHFETY